jgi:FKBP-type peptidyl-prolyl cis-trans isomerase
MGKRSLVAIGLITLAAGGCEPPPDDLSPVDPPGLYRDRTPEKDKGLNGPQARGEVGPQRDMVTGGSESKSAAGETAKSAEPEKPPAAAGDTFTTKAGAKVEVLQAGKGDRVKPGSIITVNYVGSLMDGTRFDSGDKKSFPMTLTGPTAIIPGWYEGLMGMAVGEKRKLTIPPHLGYGPEGSPPKIPGNATLLFSVELLEVR